MNKENLINPLQQLILVEEDLFYDEKMNTRSNLVNIQ